MLMKYLVIVLLWSGYCILHSYLISIGFTKLMGRLLKEYYAFYRLFYIIISVVLLVPLINYTTRLDHEVIITYMYPLSIVRYVLMWGSLLLFFWAFFFNYDSLSFFGIRQILNFKKEKKIGASETKKKWIVGNYEAPHVFLFDHLFVVPNL